MNSTINIYQTLNEREKYILDKLEIKERDLNLEDAVSVIRVMRRMTDRISELPLTRKQVFKAVQDLDQFRDLFFEGVEMIKIDEDYPDIKINIYKPLSKETKKTLKLLDIKVKDREYTAREYVEISNILLNKLLIKYGTGIKKNECVKLTWKIWGLFYINSGENDII